MPGGIDILQIILREHKESGLVSFFVPDSFFLSLLSNWFSRLLLITHFLTVLWLSYFVYRLNAFDRPYCLDCSS